MALPANQLWWPQGALTADGSGEEVVPASDYRALQSQVRELQRLRPVELADVARPLEALEKQLFVRPVPSSGPRIGAPPVCMTFARRPTRPQLFPRS